MKKVPKEDTKLSEVENAIKTSQVDMNQFKVINKQEMAAKNGITNQNEVLCTLYKKILQTKKKAGRSAKQM